MGAKVFPAGDTASGGQGSSVDGLPCFGAAASRETTSIYHIHAHVTLFHNGTQLAIPIAIGLINPVYSMGGNYADSGKCFYPLHVHDNTGIIHIENTVPFTATMGELFDIWGQPLTTSDIAGFSGPTLVWVGTSLFTGDPRTITLTNREQITLEVGGPYVFPPFYTWI